MTDDPIENPKEEKAAVPEQAESEQKDAAASDAKATARQKAPAVTVKRGKGARPKQCSECKKNLKKKTWYYRSNQYFCNKNCWKTSTAKAPKAPVAA